MMSVMHNQIGFANAVAKLDDFNVAVGLAVDALVAVLAEN